MDDLLQRVRRLAGPEAAPDPALLAELARSQDATLVREAGRHLAALDPRLVTPPGRTPRPLRVAVVPSFTADNVLPLLRVHLLAAGIAPEFRLTAPDQQLMALGRPGSPLDDFAPDLTLCLAHEDVFLPRDWDPTDLAGLAAAVDERAERYTAAVASFAGRTTGSVLLHTVPLPSAWPRTVTSHRSRAGIGRLWRELNLRLLDLAERTASLDALDLETLLADCPSPLRDERLFRFASMAWAPAVERLYAREAAGYGRALAGLGKKCLVLDLDNTLWGGVLGDDGPENIEIGPMYPGNAYAAVQRTALALRRQGVLLAVASKNDPGLVARVLAEHPELVLRRDDFVSVHAGWDAKDGSIRAIADELNIGLDSVVFLDDSPFECDLVRSTLPQVEVVRAAGDPAQHVNTLLSGGYFDVLDTTVTDARRTDLYRARVERREWTERQGQASPADYLEGLGLEVTVRAADAYLLPRIIQLGGRTNQFNLTGSAHAEAETRRMAGSDDHEVLGFAVRDRFGDEGVVGALWIARHPDRWIVQNAVMSCRVFSRGIEFAVLAAVADAARDAGASRIEADFRDSGRNGPAARFLADAGFTARDAPAADGTVRHVLPLEPAPALAPAWISVRDERPVPTEGRRTR
ncbi:HAD-IIIC family phosphatase [Streptomyces sp. NPDC056002]|uniref:HAD-IIIC family phosphatase n=1 Tax=Streptomyces sp. NPDC056002 TaxID=3345675 RepID=UPI0035DA71A1